LKVCSFSHGTSNQNAAPTRTPKRKAKYRRHAALADRLDRPHALLTPVATVRAKWPFLSAAARTRKSLRHNDLENFCDKTLPPWV
jgi:hypothetical protein